jgi:hypothetical protein
LLCGRARGAGVPCATCHPACCSRTAFYVRCLEYPPSANAGPTCAPSVAKAAATIRVDLIDIAFLCFRFKTKLSSFRPKKTDCLVRPFRKFRCRSARHYADGTATPNGDENGPPKTRLGVSRRISPSCRSC